MAIFNEFKEVQKFIDRITNYNMISCWRDLTLLVAVAKNVLLLGLIPLVQVRGAGTTEQDAGNQTIEESMILNIPNKEGLDYCSVANYVLKRNDGLVGDANPCANSMRPYSITMNEFSWHHDRVCKNGEELLDGIKYGTRRWDNPSHESLPPEEREAHPSYFVPHDCDIPVPSPSDMCNIMNEYSYVINVEDSLSRHLHQALFSGLRNDLVLGGIHSSDGNGYGRCRCDGQFSKHEECRSNDGLFFEARPRDLNV